MKFNVFCNNSKTKVLLEISENDNGSAYASSIDDVLLQAEQEIKLLDETIETVNTLKPQCEKIDYILAASSGALCGLLDVFLIANPGDSSLGDVTDKWFEGRTCDFAKLCGWEGNSDNPVKSAIGYLERTFKVPYDQRGCGDAGRMVFGLTPSNHHFKSLAHNPSLLGLFFSVLNQFTNTSHFVSGGQLVSLQEADGRFELQGNNFISKLWCGIVNWIGHLMSDISGASGSKSRGTGIPSPLWTWTNSVIAIKTKLDLSANEFDKSVNELALNLFNEGYDARFQTAQAIPVLINELIVRLLYAVRRLIKYYRDTPRAERSFKCMWKACEPFKNLTVKRMLTVAHSTFCLIDVGDAVVRGFITGGGMFNPVEFFLRLNLVGVGRLTISLYGETKLAISYHRAQRKAEFAKSEKIIVEDYIEGLKLLQSLYEDKEYLACIKDLIEGRYLEAFKKSQAYAESQGVPDTIIIRTKTKIDEYFLK
ncbi:MAG TPA: hypothetical protein OIM39_00380 [Bacteroidaceae bacterium]|nr:hypothetical protein [Bacteroidaceae bacterium]